MVPRYNEPRPGVGSSAASGAGGDERATARATGSAPSCSCPPSRRVALADAPQRRRAGERGLGRKACRRRGARGARGAERGARRQAMGAPLLGGGDNRAREERRRAKEEAEVRALDALGALLRPHVTQGSRERAKDIAHTALAGAGFGAVIGAAWGGFREVRGIRHELQVNERVRAAAAVAAARSGHTAGHVKQQPLSEGLFTGYKMQSLSFMLSRAVRGAAVYGGASLAYAGLFDALRFGGGLDALGVDTSAARGESGDSKPHALAVGATAAVIVGLANASLAAPSIAMRAGRATIGLTVGGVAGWAVGRLQAELFRWAKEKQMLEALREEAAVAGKAL